MNTKAEILNWANPFYTGAPTPEQFRSMGSETEKYRFMTARYCEGAGVDVASQGVAVVPWAMSFDLPEREFLHYSNGMKPKGPIHLRGFADHLPFESGSLDFVYSSHLLEDFRDWLPCLAEWTRCVKIGGYLIILIPDNRLWDEAIARGQSPNCSHRHCGRVGELTEVFVKHFGHFEILEDRLTAVTPEDYTIIFAAQRTA